MGLWNWFDIVNFPGLTIITDLLFSEISKSPDFKLSQGMYTHACTNKGVLFKVYFSWAIAFTIFFSAVAMESLLIVHCRVGVIGAAAPHRSVSSKTYCIKLAHVMAERNEMKIDLFQCDFISHTFSLKQYLNNRTLNWRKCSIKEQKYKNTK